MDSVITVSSATTEEPVAATETAATEALNMGGWLGWTRMESCTAMPAERFLAVMVTVNSDEGNVSRCATSEPEPRGTALPSGPARVHWMAQPDGAQVSPGQPRTSPSMSFRAAVRRRGVSVGCGWGTPAMRTAAGKTESEAVVVGEAVGDTVPEAEGVADRVLEAVGSVVAVGVGVPVGVGAGETGSENRGGHRERWQAERGPIVCLDALADMPLGSGRETDFHVPLCTICSCRPLSSVGSRYVPCPPR